MDLSQSLEKLVNSTMFTKECTIGGTVITLKLLSSTEEGKLSKLIDEISATDSVSALGDWKNYLLSLAMYKIAGEVLPEIIDVGEERMEKGLYLRSYLEKLPSTIVENLFEIYKDMKDEAVKALDKSMVYVWFKDPETRRKEEEDQKKTDSQVEEPLINPDDDQIELKKINT